MGWDFTQGATKSDIVEQILTLGADDGRQVSPIAHKVVGKNLWVVWQDGEERVLVLYLLDRHAGFGWGYKTITEAMGPYETNVPAEFLALATHQTSTAFRERVRAAQKA
jgi:hypothetical protein